MIHFAISGPGSISGVGNGDPRCLEPDTMAIQPPVKLVSVTGWRCSIMKIPGRNEAPQPEYAAEFNDTTWPLQTLGNGDEIPTDQSAIYRAHFTVTAEDLASPGIQVRFPIIKDHGWIFVNNQLIGNSSTLEDEASFHSTGLPPYQLPRKLLHEGDNILAVALMKRDFPGGIGAGVTVEVIGTAVTGPWSRSLFNGLAQIIVQSNKTAGEIILTATADDLKPVTMSIQAEACMPRPSVP